MQARALCEIEPHDPITLDPSLHTSDHESILFVIVGDANFMTTVVPFCHLQCPRGAAAAIPCPAGTSASSNSLVSVEGCEVCPLGYWCAQGTSVPEPCSAGKYGDATGQETRDCSGDCSKGHFCLEGSTSPTSGVCRERCHYTDSSSCTRTSHLRAHCLSHLCDSPLAPVATQLPGRTTPITVG